ncbi:MAG TPA: hypothetical protein VKH42_02670, partial [Vicinamibacterales bacterium]|nr:hypothetical protein [Vicinamibacterales bacterium]
MGTTFRTAVGLAAIVALTVVHVRGAGAPGVKNAAQQTQPPQQPSQQPPAAAGQPQQQQPPSFRTNINYVRVDVITTDKKGNPIGDLKATDFEILEDNKPQTIDTFKLVQLDGGTQDSITEAPRQIRTDFDEESEAAKDDVRLFAFFLDDYHVRKGTSMATANPLFRFIQNQIGPTDMVGVMYPLQPTSSIRFTRNHGAVATALQRFRGRKYDYTPMNMFEEQYAHQPTEVVEKIRNQVSISAIKSLITHMG